ncbi:MAG: valine--tRNA ligase [Chlamydiales bacterium]|nr:valine--tRNA ligase [Chlamydiales bacterium]
MMSQELPTSYDHLLTEKKWYTFWEEIKAFKADPHSRKPPFCIILPPPNVTGALHMGHALVDTIQDILIRYKRMKGFEVLWVPGTDHAGIATQTLVEKHLIAKEGKRRIDYSREDFLSHVYAWKDDYQRRIIDQLKQVGCSCDWSKLRFTMDDDANLAVKTIFKKMYEEGLIYQGDYLVNWDPVTQTALADDEVEYEEKDGSIWYFRYPIIGTKDHIVIATTRPETMLGDTAVAVALNDERYQDWIGKKIKLPITGREIPIIADHYVDKEFGSGAVKITPAHDFNDYEIGLRHNLPMINIMTPDGKINEKGFEFTGLSMEEARAAIVKRMKELHLLEKIVPHTNRVGVSYRSKAIIEPYLSKQWFVKISLFKDKLIEAVREKKVKIVPDYWEKTYFNWIENLRDWCISRQLWWGHRIPIWHHMDGKRKICFIEEGVPSEVLNDPDNWYQDDDVLDTWFSSALWPFSSLGWPTDTTYLKKFYPTSVLVTGHDILFFWVARMIFMGEYALNEIPFHETFIHGLIYGKSYWRKKIDGSIEYVNTDERLQYELGEKVPEDVLSRWEKMSKSKGNVINPLEIIQNYGADAMRMALCSSVTHARQIDLDRRRFEEFKNFSNKMWNASRFIFMNIKDLSSQDLLDGIDILSLQLEDKWILSKLHECIETVERSINSYDFDTVATCLYRFFWDEFCAYYVEFCKPYLFSKAGDASDRKTKQKLLVYLLLVSIRLMHPIVPFITEELFQLLKKQFPNLSVDNHADFFRQETIQVLREKACIVAPFPQLIAEFISSDVIKDFDMINQVLHQIRLIRGQMGLAPSASSDIYFSYDVKTPLIDLLEKNQQMIKSLIRTSKLQIHHHKPSFAFSSSAKVDQLEITIPLPEEFKEKECLRLIKEKEKLIKQIEGNTNKLSNAQFMERAPKDLVIQTQEKVAEDKMLLTKIDEMLTQLT